MLMIRLSNNIDDCLVQSQYMDKLMYFGFFPNNIQILEEIFKTERSLTTEGCSVIDISFNSQDYAEGFGVVARNFSYELLYAAARTGNLKILEMLIKVGILSSMDEDYYGIDNEVGATAVQFAIEHRQEAVIQRLFAAEINVGAKPVSHLSPSLLWTAVIFDRADLVADLIKLGARDTPKKFENSHLSSRYESHLKSLDLHWGKRIGSRFDGVKVVTALQLSVTGSRYDCFRVLAEEHALRRHFSCSRGRIGIIHLALVEKDYLMMERILARYEFLDHIDQPIGTEINGRSYACTALALAIYNLDARGTELLVARGAGLVHVNLESLRDKFEQPFRGTQELSSLPPPYSSYFNSLHEKDLYFILDTLAETAWMWDEEVSLTGLLQDSSDYDSDSESEKEDVTEISQFGHRSLADIFKLVHDLFKDYKSVEEKFWATFLALTCPFFQKLEIRIQKDTRRESGKSSFIRDFKVIEKPCAL
ncbi:hypothetical protein H072_6464 [Dactylellina haptotyla CBS 200.50]|uniref:Uncharacterized protein n=1 Tax=Dactylellina haptotyla (strain CBS 200.50) TaxID=1284197 RepID=S8BWN1_DACHA|nr:hypothetical protein H072_6464 [Dactylellina haptotyla CBS 200.50]